MAHSIEHLATLLAFSELLPAEPRDLSDLLQTAGGLERLVEGTDDLGHNRGRDLLIYLRRSNSLDRSAFWIDVLTKLMEDRPTVQCLIVTDSDYPDLLRSAYNCPPFIFLDGTYRSTDAVSLAVVGSRKADDQTLEFTEELSIACARNRVTVISGLAQGVDAAAHRSSLRAGGRTIGVIASGIDQPVYPPSNARLAESVTKSGCIVSQFRPGSPATASAFVARNAVISALAPASLIAEAAERSGTRSEAEHALKQGRLVLLWAPIVKQQWAQRFMHEPGVMIVETVRDVLEVLRSMSVFHIE